MNSVKLVCGTLLLAILPIPVLGLTLGITSNNECARHCQTLRLKPVSQLSTKMQFKPPVRKPEQKKSPKTSCVSYFSFFVHVIFGIEVDGAGRCSGGGYGGGGGGAF